MPDRKDEVLLRVEHLCQYFKENKAVDDVSFDIKKGEVFGLVGESGCGKTTTGRSIIKLYNITSGSIYFKGHRIAAGTRSYKQAIAQARVEMKSAAPERQKELKDFIAAQRAEIRSARHDHQNCDKLYAGELVREVEERYQPLLASAQSEELARLKEHYAYDRRAARKQRALRDPARGLHRLDLLGGFDLDHCKASSFSNKSRVVSATASCPSTTTSLPRWR